MNNITGEHQALMEEMTDFPTLSVHDPYSFMSLKPEKGTPFGTPFGWSPPPLPLLSI